MKLLAFPERKLLTGYVIGIDGASGPNVTVVEKWFEDGRYQCFVDGLLVHESHVYERPPFVKFNVTGSPWERE